MKKRRGGEGAEQFFLYKIIFKYGDGKRIQWEGDLSYFL